MYVQAIFFSCVSLRHTCVGRRRALVEQIPAGGTNSGLKCALTPLGLQPPFGDPLGLQSPFGDPLGLQSPFGDKPLEIRVVCPRNGTAVLKGFN